MAAMMGDDGRRGGNRWRWATWGLAAGLLLLPAVAMQFTSEVDWGPEDFVAFGLMLLAACGAIELAMRMSRSVAYRLGAGVAVLAHFLLVWADLAVGIHGDRPNWVFLGLPVLTFVAAALARFRAQGMVYAMLATAVAQVAIAVDAWLASSLEFPLPVLTFVYVGIWLASAALFAMAARDAAR
jgi:hypothetical protein